MRTIPRYRDGRLLFTNTEDEDINTLDERQRERQELGEKISDGVKAWKYFQFGASDVPHISEEQRIAARENMSSEDAFEARDTGAISAQANLILTAKFEDLLLTDADGEPDNFTDDAKRGVYFSELEKDGFVPAYAIDVGINSFACLYLYVKTGSDSTPEMIYIADAYNYHARRAATKHVPAEEHLSVISRMIAKNGSIIHSGIIDGTARIDQTNKIAWNWAQYVNNWFFGDPGASIIVNSKKLNDADLNKRVIACNELMHSGRLKIMYSAHRQTRADIKRGTHVLKDQMGRWRYKVDEKSGARSFAQKGENTHLVKDCLSALVFRDNLRLVIPRNRYARFHRPG